MTDIYLASPYSHPDPAVREQRYEQVCEATAALIRQGWSVFSPIVHSHNLVKYGLPTEWSFWQRMDSEMLAQCKMVVVLALPGWDESEGVQAETHIARHLDIPIRFATFNSLMNGELTSVAARIANLMEWGLEQAQCYIDEAKKLGWEIELDADDMFVMRKGTATLAKEQPPCQTR